MRLLLPVLLILSTLLCTRSACADESQRPLTLEEARQYMLSLINRDRQSQGLGPVALDAVATRAAQVHADEQAKLNFSSHVHPDGSKPPERYNNAGGTNYVAENSHGIYIVDPFQPSIPQAQLFTRELLEKEESGFFNEAPPHDGHRRNILNPRHTHVGIGLTVVDCLYKGTLRKQFVACSQEFIASYGEIRVSSRKLNASTPYVIEGTLNPGISLSCISVRREPLPQPISAEEMVQRTKTVDSYGTAQEKVAAIFPPPSKQAPCAQLTVRDRFFRCQITPLSSWEKGLYYLIVWARSEPNGQQFPIGMVTVRKES